MDEITTLLSGLPWGAMTPGGILGLFVVLLFTGKITTEREVLRERENAETWKQAHREAQETARILGDSSRTMEEAAQTMKKLMDSLPTVEDVTETGDDTDGGAPA